MSELAVTLSSVLLGAVAAGVFYRLGAMGPENSATDGGHGRPLETSPLRRRPSVFLSSAASGARGRSFRGVSYWRRYPGCRIDDRLREESVGGHHGSDTQ